MDIPRQHVTFLLINAIGGVAVLGSYVWGFVARPEEAGQLWGGVPLALRPVYTTFMLLATTGYFFFTAFFLTRIDPESTVLAGGQGWGTIQALYAAVLVASALWLPLTVVMVREPGDGLWLAIRVVLGVVGLASIGLLILLLASDIDKSGWLYPAAVAGLLAFCFQTAVLDGLVWPHYFR